MSRIRVPGKKFLPIVSLSMLLATVLPASAVITTTTSGVYDENTVQANEVDLDSFVSGTIDGMISRVSLENFTTDVATAYAADLGGVMNFDDAGGATGDTSIAATYGVSQANMLTITATTGSFTIGQADAIKATPISGHTYLRQGSSTTYSFSLPVSEFGFTVLARSTELSITTTLTYSDGSTAKLSGVSVAANSSSTPNSDPDSAPDTFFGFSAPAGLTISSVSISGGAGFPVLDDVGFVAVPEPASMSVLFVGAVTLGGFLRRRRS